MDIPKFNNLAFEARGQQNTELAYNVLLSLYLLKTKFLSCHLSPKKLAGETLLFSQFMDLY